MAELVYPPVLGFVHTFFRVLRLRIRVDGVANLPATGGGVLAINHVGYLDFVFAGLSGRHARPKRLVRFMAKEEIFHHPVAGPLMRGMHHISVDRLAGADAYLSAVEALRAGELVGVFPEATISRSFELKGFKTGAARMAMEAGVPIIPIITWGSQRLITKGRPPHWRRKTPILVRVGAPIAVAPDADVNAVTDELRAQMSELLTQVRSEYPDQPSGDDDRWWLPASLGGTAPTLAAADELDRHDAAERRSKRDSQSRAAETPPE